MNIARKIFDRVNILKVTFKGADEYSYDLLTCTLDAGKPIVKETSTDVKPGELSKVEKKVPFVAVFCGYGIISRERDSLPAAVVEKIDTGSEEFISGERDGVITLLRREQVAECIGELDKAGIPCAAMAVSVSPEDGMVLDAAQNQLVPQLRLRRMLRPDRTGAALSGIFVSKIKLPFLILVLVVLVANHFRGERIKAEAASLRFEIQAYEKAVGAAGEADRQRAGLIAGYQRKLPHGFSWICDRIAIGLPKTMSLTTLKIQPVVKKIENGKPLYIVQRRIEITGQAFDAEDVSLFVTALTRLNFTREVKMASLEHNRNTGELDFRLLLEL